MDTGEMRRIGVLGHGAIGGQVAGQIAQGRVAGARLAGVVVRTRVRDARIRQLTMAQALEECDLVVECAGQQAVREHARIILDAGVDLLLTSIGALADQVFADSLHRAGPGRLFHTSGAVGGLDRLASAARLGGFDQARLVTIKKPSALIQPWMSDAEKYALETTTEPVEVFGGTAREAAGLFPKSLNIAAAVALALGDWEVLQVRLVANPAARLTEHHITADGDAGEYSFTIRNRPAPGNPRTSGVVPWAVLRSVESIIGQRGGLI